MHRPDAGFTGTRLLLARLPLGLVAIDLVQACCRLLRGNTITHHVDQCAELALVLADDSNIFLLLRD